MSRAVRIASLIWGVSILASRLIGLVREAVIGRMLGGGAEADVYWTAFVLPDFLNYLLAGGALSIVFIPLFQAHLAKENSDGAWKAFSAIANFLVIALVLLTVGLSLACPLIAPRIAPGMTPDQHVLLVRLIRIILPAQIFHLLGGLCSATLQAQDKHALPAMAPLIYTGSIVVAGLLFGEQYGAEAFAWGVLAGSFLGPFLLVFLGAIRHGLKWKPIFSLRHPDFKTYIWRSLPIMIGLSIVVVDDWMLKRVGSGLGEGVISRLQYARTLMRVPMGVFGLAAGVATFPTLSRMFANGDKEGMFKTLISSLRMTVFLALMASVVLGLASADIAEVIWGTKRFNSEALQEIGYLTLIVSVGLWAWAAQSLVARGFYAQGRTAMPVFVGTGVTLCAYPLYVFLGQKFAATGLAWASTVALSIYVVVLLFTLARSLNMHFTLAGAIVALRMLLATALALGAGLALKLVSASVLSMCPVIIRAVVLCGLAGVLFLVFALLFRLPDCGVLKDLLLRVLRKFRRRAAA